MRSSENIIKSISDIRNNNNVLWMRLLEIAMKHAPTDAKAALRQINANDKAVSDLIGELAK